MRFMGESAEAEKLMSADIWRQKYFAIGSLAKNQLEWRLRKLELETRRSVRDDCILLDALSWGSDYLRLDHFNNHDWNSKAVY